MTTNRNDDDYDAADDLSRSIAECYRAIRERIARGGPPWVPPDIPPIPERAESSERHHTP
jgi:hypothetical protein